jgi:hypothetical protein
MPSIQLATVLPGAMPFKEGNVNETYRGQVLLSDNSVRGAILKDLDARQLANELLVSALAQQAGLPTPEAYLALVRGGDLPVVHGPYLLYGFDAWVANIDRHPGNLLFGGKEQVWLIDHGHCLSGPSWTPEDLQEDGDYQNRLTEWLTSRMNLDQKKKRSAEANKLATTLRGIDVEKTAAASHARALLPSAHIAAASSFLTGRVDKVPRHASKALGIPVML